MVRLRLVAAGGLWAALNLHAATQRALPDGYTRRVWQTQDGLPENTVQAFAQTPDNYLWIGTSGGLVRFDGAGFVIYDRDNTPAMGEDSIFCLTVGRDGSLWYFSCRRAWTASAPLATALARYPSFSSSPRSTRWLVRPSSATRMRAPCRARDNPCGATARPCAASRRVSSSLDALDRAEGISKIAVNQNVEPSLTLLRNPIFPPIISTNCLAIDSPRPVPPYLRVVDVSAWTNDENNAAPWAGRIPIPVSAMEKRRVALPVSWLSTSTCTSTLPRSVNLMALAVKLIKTWRSRLGSPPRSVGVSGAARQPKASPLAFARVRRAWKASSAVRRRSKSTCSSAIFPASILDRSRMSSMSASSVRPLVSITSA